MKKLLVVILGSLASINAFAVAEHYVRSQGGHVQHLKVNRLGNEIYVSMDVDFEPVGEVDEGKRPCSHRIDGVAQVVGENDLLLRKQAEGEAHYCELTIHLGSDEATVRQSKDCSYFLGTYCKFESEGSALKKVK
jgi:hypothetical protein